MLWWIANLFASLGSNIAWFFLRLFGVVHVTRYGELEV